MDKIDIINGDVTLLIKDDLATGAVFNKQLDKLQKDWKVTFPAPLSMADATDLCMGMRHGLTNKAAE